MDGNRTDYILRYIDGHVNAALTAGHTITKIKMTAGAQEMLRRRYFPAFREQKPDSGILRYRGYPVETGQLDVPAIVCADPVMPR